jgi:hypothetical protein
VSFTSILVRAITPPRLQLEILQLASQHVIAGEEAEISVESSVKKRSVPGDDTLQP